MIKLIFQVVLIGLFIKALFPNKKHYNRRENYERYIHSSAWKRKRERVLKRDNYRCRKCGRCNCRLEVHHLTYKHFGNEPLEDLLTVCSKCHHRIHKKARI